MKFKPGVLEKIDIGRIISGLFFTCDNILEHYSIRLIAECFSQCWFTVRTFDLSQAVKLGFIAT